MIMTTVAAMSEGARHEEEARHRDIAVTKEPLPEPIYDLTKDDETESLKAAGPRERGDED